MQRELCAYLQDVMDASDALHKFVADVTFDEFRENDLLRSGVERKFEIIGEALSQASQTFPGSIDSVTDLSAAIGQRHRIAHGYFVIDPAKLWVSIEADIPVLREQIALLIEANCNKA